MRCPPGGPVGRRRCGMSAARLPARFGGSHRPPIRRTGLPAANAIELPSPCELTPETLSFHVDEEGRVWAAVDRRTFLVGTSAALLAQAGIGLADGSIRGQPSSGGTGW